MKSIKSVPLILISACLLFAQFANADSPYCPEKTMDEQILCPKQVDCTEEANLSSCTALNGDMRYWNMVENGRVEKGTYTFDGALSSYQRPIYNNSTCIYKNNIAGFPKYIYVVNKIEAAYFEANPKNSKWIISGYGAQYNGNEPSECPLTRASIFIIRNVSQISVNNVIIPCIPQESSSLRKVTSDEAVKYCFNENIPICNFDIKQGANFEKIASVIVDIKNKMKILKIIQIDQSRYEVKLIDGLNSIEVIDKNALKK